MPGKPAPWRQTATFRLPRNLLDAAKTEAARRGISVTKLIELALADVVVTPPPPQR